MLERYEIANDVLTGIDVDRHWTNLHVPVIAVTRNIRSGPRRVLETKSPGEPHAGTSEGRPKKNNDQIVP